MRSKNYRQQKRRRGGVGKKKEEVGEKKEEETRKKEKERKKTELEIKNKEQRRRKETIKCELPQEKKVIGEILVIVNPIQQEEIKEPIYEIISFDQIELQEQINNNDHPEVEVYKCLIRSSNTQAAVKIYSDLDKLLPTAEFEANVYKKLNRNKAFVEFYGSFRHENKYYIVLEYIQKSLESIINSSNEEKYDKRRKFLEDDEKSRKFSEDDEKIRNCLKDDEKIRKFLEDLVAGLIDLKNLGIAHRDIKPGNILFANFKPKIIDFGSS